MKKSVRVAILLVLAIVWMSVIYGFSSMPSNVSGTNARGIISRIINYAISFSSRYGYLDHEVDEKRIAEIVSVLYYPLRKVAHSTVYMILVLFIFRTTTVIANHRHYIICLMVTLVICTAFAMTDEFHQTFVDGRSGLRSDVLIDAIGILAGAILYSTYYFIFTAGYRIGIKKQPKIQQNTRKV